MAPIGDTQDEGGDPKADEGGRESVNNLSSFTASDAAAEPTSESS